MTSRRMAGGWRREGGGRRGRPACSNLLIRHGRCEEGGRGELQRPILESCCGGQARGLTLQRCGGNFGDPGLRRRKERREGLGVKIGDAKPGTAVVQEAGGRGWTEGRISRRRRRR